MQLRRSKIRLPLAALVLVSLSAAPARAQEAQVLYGPRSGDFLTAFNLSYGFTNTDGQEAEELTARAALSWFVTRHHELGLDLTAAYRAIEGGGDSSSHFLGPLYNFNFYLTPRTNLYAGGRLGLAISDTNETSSQTDFAYGLQAGLRYWLTPRVAFDVEPRYTRTELDSADLDHRDAFGILLGFNVVL
jgi:opacity protein-like surface antigen